MSLLPNGRRSDVRRRVTRLSILVLATVFSATCAKDPEPPPPSPPMCAKVERGTDAPIEDVLCSSKDDDADGVDNAVDLCPSLPESRDGIHDLDGCPDPDGDQDGILDAEDGCPDKKGPPPDGCPLVDTDADGIPNHLDACPTRAEDKDGDQDADGCPEGERGLSVGALSRQLWRTGHVEFRRGKNETTEAGARELSAVVDVIEVDGNDVALVRIRSEAHSTELKRRSKLDRLVKNRAEQIEESILALGIAPGRIETTTEVRSRKSPRGPGVVDVEVFLTTAAATRRAETDSDGGVRAGLDGGASSNPNSTTTADSPPADGGPDRPRTADPF